MDIYRIMNGLVDNATSEQLNGPDMNAMREVSELVRSRADMPKEVIKLINNKLMKRDKKVTLLCLELLEYLTYACEITLYNQIATKDFLLKMGTILKSHDLGEMVISRACRLIKCWRDLFNKDLHQFFFQFYDNVVKKGIEIPSNYASPYANLKGSVPSVSTSSSSFKAPSASTAQKQPVPASGPKAKLRSDLELIKQNITIVNEMIDNQDHRQNVEQNDALNDLIPTLKKQETQMQSLVEKLAMENDESLLELCLQLNDDLLATQERYASLKRHMKPKPFRGKAVEDDVLEQISKLSVSNNNDNGFSQSVFSESAQTLNQSVAKAQLKIPPPGQSFQQSQPQQSQPVQQVQQPPAQVSKPATNLLDLLDDEEEVKPAVVPQQAPQVQQTNGFNQGQPPVQQNQPSLTQLYNQSATIQNQQQQMQEQNKYQVFNTLAQPNTMAYNPMAGNAMGAPMGYNTMGQMGGAPMGYNTMAGGMGAMGGAPMGYNTMAGGMGAMGAMGGAPMGYNGMGGGYGNTLPPQQNSFLPSMNTNSNMTGGYGGGMPMSSTLPPVNNSGAYGAQNQKKDAFDDLDDMFGIGGPSTGGSSTGMSNNNNNANNGFSVSNSQPAKQTVDFDLF